MDHGHMLEPLAPKAWLCHGCALAVPQGAAAPKHAICFNPCVDLGHLMHTHTQVVTFIKSKREDYEPFIEDDEPFDRCA